MSIRWITPPPPRNEADVLARRMAALARRMGVDWVQCAMCDGSGMWWDDRVYREESWDECPGCDGLGGEWVEAEEAT